MDSATVLVVEDEEELADLYVEWLSGTYDVRSANTSEEGVELLDETVDVALIDRRLPDASGDELVDLICSQGLDCKVAMVTAVDPDVDILALGFDDYVVKPVTSDDLHGLVEGLLARSEYSDEVSRFYALVSKHTTLTAQIPEQELEENNEYNDLTEEIEALKANLDSRVAAFEENDYTALLQDLRDTSDDSPRS